MEIPHKSGRDRTLAVRKTGRIYEPGEYAVIRLAELTEAPADVAVGLGLDPGAEVIRRQRVTCNADGTVESMSTSWYDGALAGVAPLLLGYERIPEGSWRYLEMQTGRVASRGLDTLETRLATEEDAEALGVPLPAAVKVSTTVLLDDTGRVIEYGVSVAAAGRRVTYDYEVPKPA